jgi:hypothetical protein
MKTLHFLLRGLAVLCLWLPLTAFAGLWVAIREARLKRELGPDYEGPLED